MWREMREEENTNVRVALPGGRKLYLLACVIYALAVVNAISNLGPAVAPHPYHSTGYWTGWLDIGIELWLIYFFVEMFTSMVNRVERVICVLTVIWLALEIPTSLHRMGYSWARVPGGNWIDLVILTVAAFLVFLRTFQVFSSRKA